MQSTLDDAIKGNVLPQTTINEATTKCKAGDVLQLPTGRYVIAKLCGFEKQIVLTARQTVCVYAGDRPDR